MSETLQTLTVELKDIRSITPYERTPRLNDKAVDAVAASLKEFGFRQPIVVDKVSDEDFEKLLDGWFGNIARVLEPEKFYGEVSISAIIFSVSITTVTIF